MSETYAKKNLTIGSFWAGGGEGSADRYLGQGLLMGGYDRLCGHTNSLKVTLISVKLIEKKKR